MKSLSLLAGRTVPYLIVYVYFDALRPSQQFFSHVGTISCLSGFNQYLAADKMLKGTTDPHGLLKSNFPNKLKRT